jgi:nitric oxide reductase NorQ protein
MHSIGKNPPLKIKNGMEFETTFSINPKSDSAFRWRATRINGHRAAKVILSNDARIQPDQRCRVRITSIKKPASKEHGHIEVEFLHQITFQLDDQLYVEPMLAKKLQALLESGRNILLDGPQGSGKTTLAGKVAEALGMEYIFFNCSAVYEATDFLATLQVRASVSGQAETVWLPTDILRALEAALIHRTKRYLIFLDEFNRCRELARNGIMPALDATRKLYNPLTGSTISIPENVLWIAAINNGRQFTGTTNVDPAQLDRFAPLKIDYPPMVEEIRLLEQRYQKVARTQIERVVRAADAIRCDENGPGNLGMRATDEACMLLAHPNFSTCDNDSLPDLLKTSFCARFPGTWQDPTTDAGQVWQIIVRTLEL